MRAERLAAEYLRQWGLRDPQTIAALSRRWVDTVDPALLSEPASLRELYQAVIRRAMADMDEWLDHLAHDFSAGPRDARSRRGLLAVEVQTVIDHCPAVLLHDGPLPPELLDQLACAAGSVVPANRPSYMPTQSLEAVAAPKYFSRCRRIGKQFWRRMQRVSSPEPSGQG